MEYICRHIEPALKAALKRGKSILLLGPRQVGKSTTIANLKPDHTISLARPALRQNYERDIERFSQEIEALADTFETLPLIAIDEIQKIPELMDAVQDLIDRKVAQFILTGSSARKLRHGKHINWLPGRVVSFHMDPFQASELPESHQCLDDLLLYGSLPGIVLEPSNEHKEQDLTSYVVTYLEEEIRQEALVRNVGNFHHFLQLAAAESGQIVNTSKLSQEIGVAHTTINAYYQILEDCLIAERIEPIATTKARRRLTKTPRYLMFDLGLRRLAAREGTQLPSEIMGRLFEQFIGLELLRMIRLKQNRLTLKFWRDLEGREVDWVIVGDTMIPIEVKWTERPSEKDAKYVTQFLDEHQLPKGYIVCRIEQDRKINERITAISWRHLEQVFDSINPDIDKR